MEKSKRLTKNILELMQNDPPPLGMFGLLTVQMATIDYFGDIEEVNNALELLFS
jgi:benzoyl-CoA reductase/2-hydroxyglutaryl-CoA dehydratase subunit BcrC/BadD/HgdB